jgi:hypothetical protein
MPRTKLSFSLKAPAKITRWRDTTTGNPCEQWSPGLDNPAKTPSNSLVRDRRTSFAEPRAACQPSVEDSLHSPLRTNAEHPQIESDINGFQRLCSWIHDLPPSYSDIYTALPVSCLQSRARRILASTFPGSAICIQPPRPAHSIHFLTSRFQLGGI